MPSQIINRSCLNWCKMTEQYYRYRNHEGSNLKLRSHFRTNKIERKNQLSGKKRQIIYQPNNETDTVKYVRAVEDRYT